MAVTTPETHTDLLAAGLTDLLAAGRKLHAHLTLKTVHPVWHLGREEQAILLEYVSCVNSFLEHHARDTLPSGELPRLPGETR